MLDAGAKGPNEARPNEIRPNGIYTGGARPGGETPGSIQLRSAEFRKGREEGWRKLEGLVERIEKNGVGSLNAKEAGELPLLYRAAMSSLSVARGIVLDRNLLLYLETLALRSYLAVYGPRSGMLENLRTFLTRDFPRYVRGLSRHLGIALIALAVGVLAGYLLVTSDINFFQTIVPEELAQGRGPASSQQSLRSSIFAPWPGFVDTFVVFANSLFRHNTIVGIMCFGLGFALGVPTVLLLMYNGLIIGAFVGLHAEKDLAVEFVGWLSIHGVTEILAILLCAAAGLVVAEKILFPGRLPRLESLALYGRRAASVAAGAVLLFFLAGILEGGFRQLITSTPLRYAFALGSGALWLAYFTRVGLKKDKGQKQDQAKADDYGA